MFTGARWPCKFKNHVSRLCSTCLAVPKYLNKERFQLFCSRTWYRRCLDRTMTFIVTLVSWPSKLSSLQVIDRLRIFALYCIVKYPILIHSYVYMVQYRVTDINSNARMFPLRMKAQGKEWKKPKDGRIFRRHTKRIHEFTTEEEEQAFREIAQDLKQFFREEEASFAQKDPGELDIVAKEKKTRALQKVQQDIGSFRTEVARPLPRKYFNKPKPPRSYYWPQKPPSAWDDSIPTTFAEKPAAGVLGPRLNIPSILLTAPDLESDSSPQIRSQVIDASMLSPTYTPRIPSTSQREPSTSQARKNRKTGGHRPLAPKPSLFSYNICNHPECPLTRYAHEKGVFKYPGRYATDEEYASAAITFGKGNPPPWIWDAYFSAMNDLKASGGDTKAVSEEDVKVVRGFAAAHPKP